MNSNTNRETVSQLSVNQRTRINAVRVWLFPCNQDNVILTTFFEIGKQQLWSGHLLAWRLPEIGEDISGIQPYWNDPDSDVGDAAELLLGQGSRMIYSVFADDLDDNIEFTSSNASDFQGRIVPTNKPGTSMTELEQIAEIIDPMVNKK